MQDCYPIIAVGVYFQVLNVTRPSKQCSKNRAESSLIKYVCESVFLHPNLVFFDVKILITFFNILYFSYLLYLFIIVVLGFCIFN